MTTKLTLIVLSLLPAYLFGQIHSESFNSKSFYDTITEFCSVDYQLTDSIWYHNRYIQTYDANGNETEQTRHYQGVESSKIERVFDQNNNAIEVKNFSWNTSTTNWSSLPFRIETYSFNSNNDVTEEQVLEIDSTGTSHILTHLTTYQYDLNNNLIKKIVSYLSETTNTLYVNYMIDYGYNGNNNITFQTDSLFDTFNNQWDVEINTFTYDQDNNIISCEQNDNQNLTTKLELTYDMNGNNISTTNLYWDTINNSWNYNNLSSFYCWANETAYYLNETKLDQTFDSNDNILDQTYYSYNNSSTLFQAVKHVSNVYDLNNQVIESIQSEYNSSTQVEEFTYKTNYSYTNNLVTNRTVYKWNDFSGTWSNYSKLEYNYDSYGNIIYYADIFWVEMINDWVLAIIYQPCESFTTVQEQEENNIIAYPNPTSGIIHLDNTPRGSRIEMIDLTGKLLLNEVISHENVTYNLNNYGISGIYLIRVISPNQKSIITHKIILE